MNNNTTDEMNFNLGFFQENFNSYLEMFLESSDSSNFFYTNFYTEFIRGDEDKLFTKEEQQEWIEEWNSMLDGELEGTEASFEEIIQDYETLDEDLMEFIIKSDEPKFTQLKEKFIAQLFFTISETWSKEEIAESIKDIEEAKKA